MMWMDDRQGPLRGHLQKKPMRRHDSQEQYQSTLILVSTTVLLGYTALIPEELSLDIKLSKWYLYLRLPCKTA